MKPSRPIPVIVDDMVKLKGRDRTGILRQMDGDWCWVEWLGTAGPRIVHRAELEKTTA